MALTGCIVSLTSIATTSASVIDTWKMAACVKSTVNTNSCFNGAKCSNERINCNAFYRQGLYCFCSKRYAEKESTYKMYTLSCHSLT